MGRHYDKYVATLPPTQAGPKKARPEALRVPPPAARDQLSSIVKPSGLTISKSHGSRSRTCSAVLPTNSR
jgi:hypothetical protein